MDTISRQIDLDLFSIEAVNVIMKWILFDIIIVFLEISVKGSSGANGYDVEQQTAYKFSDLIN